MTKEKTLLNNILLQVRSVLFRNNVALSWVGRVIKDRQTPNGRNIELVEARPIKSGLTRGASDLIGWTVVEINPEMVGQKVAVFTAIEAKTPSMRVSKAQANFIGRLKESGGLAGIARSVEDAEKIVSRYTPPAPPKNDIPEQG